MADQWGRASRPGDSGQTSYLVYGWLDTLDPDGNVLTTRRYDSYPVLDYYNRSGRTASVIRPDGLRPPSGWTNVSYQIRYLNDIVKRFDSDKGYVDVVERNRKFLTSPQLQTLLRAAALSSTGRPDFGLFPLSQARTQALLKLGDRKMSLGESILEARSTLATAVNLTHRVYRLQRYARRGQWGRLAHDLGIGTKVRYRRGPDGKVLRDSHGKPIVIDKKFVERIAPDSRKFANQWLEYSYGIIPILLDASDAWNLFKDGLSRNPLIFAVERNIVRHHRETGLQSGIDFNVESTRTTRVKVYAQLNKSFTDNIQRLGLINPVELGWAVGVPFSFVIDWFLPIGSMLEASTARSGLTFISGTESAKSEWTAYFDIPLPKDTTRYQYFGRSNGIASGSCYYRRVYYSFPSAGLWVQSPFSISKVTTLLSLLRQIVRR